MMLPERYRRLLTAYVDGALSERERRLVERLVERSATARGLLRQLERDAARLRRLACPPLPGDLTGLVLDAIARRRISPPRLPRTLSRPPAYPAWASLVTAAAVLLVLGLSAYLYINTTEPRPEAGRILARGDQAIISPAQPQSVERPPVPDPGEAPTPEPVQQPKPAAAPEKPVDVARDEPEKSSPATNPVAPPAPREVLTSQDMGRFEMKMVDVDLPTTLKVRELDQNATRKQLLDELKKDHAFRIELPCRNATRALERLQSVGREQAFGFVHEPLALARMKSPQVVTHYAIFAEDLTAEELAQLLQQVGIEDRKGLDRRPPDIRFDRLVLRKMNRYDRKELADLLGIDPAVPVSPRSMGPLGTDPRRPLTELTANQVSQSLAVPGSARPEPGKAAPPPVRHVTLVLPYGLARPRHAVPEVKAFLDARTPARPGTLQIMLVLRSLPN
jgi:hypothetical protein